MAKDTNHSHGQNLNRYLFYTLILFLYLVPITIVFINGFDNFFQLFRRITGLAGIASLFIAILLSLLVRQSRQMFGVTYLKVHHLFSITGLILTSLHPVIMAIDFGTSKIFIPDFSSWNAFLANAGRPALYLIYIATIAAILRRNIAKYWRYIHSLLYLAFIFGAIHGILSGSDLTNPVLYVLYVGMIITVMIVFLYKRVIIGKK
ncbi:MAG: ferric reductase-like transmembrane domain-containing protein [Atribacterota bacterium]